MSLKKHIIFIAILVFSAVINAHTLDEYEQEDMLEKSANFKAIKDIIYNSKKFKTFDYLQIIKLSEEFKIFADNNGMLSVKSKKYGSNLLRESATTKFDLRNHIIFNSKDEIISMSLRKPPAEIFTLLNKLKSITYLSLYETNIGKDCAKVKIGDMPKLKELYLQRNNICEITFANKYNSLNTLNLFYSNTNKINNIAALKNLTNINLHNIKLKTLPDGFYSLKNLKQIDIGNLTLDNVKSLDNFKKLEKLETLGLKTNNFPELHNLSNLKHLNLYDSDPLKFIRKLPSGLTYLMLNGKEDGIIPDLTKLTDLEELYLSACNIKKIPDLSAQKKLKKLFLPNNQIKEIENLDSLITLEELHLQGNSISTINGFNKLSSLIKLNLSQNNISKISGLDNLTALKELNLAKNKINSVDGIFNLQSIEDINLEDNQVEILDNFEAFNQIPTLKYIGLEYSLIKNYEFEEALKLRKDLHIDLIGTPYFEDLREGNRKLYKKLLRANKI